MRRLSKFLYIVCVLAFVVAILGAFGSFRMSLNGEKEISQYKTAQKNFDTKLEILKKRSMLDGDMHAYDEYMNLFLKSNQAWTIQRYLPISMFVANKYHYAPACYDVYYLLSEYYYHTSTVDEVDEETARFVLHYLFLASEQGYKKALNLLETCKSSPLNETNVAVFYELCYKTTNYIEDLKR